MMSMLVNLGQLIKFLLKYVPVQKKIATQAKIVYSHVH